MPYNKYYKQKKQVSFDEGQTWQDVIPYEYQKGALYEENLPDCQQTGTKLQATYSGGQTYEKECDGNLTLTSGDTNPSGYESSAMTEAIVGDCVTTIGDNAFNTTNLFLSLTSVTIPNSVTSIGYRAFYNLYNNVIKRINSLVDGVCNIPDSVTSIGDMAFFNCDNFTSIHLPTGITTLSEGVFMSCEGLTSIDIPNGVTSIGDDAFAGCSSLTSVTIPNSVTSIGQALFIGCGSLTSVGPVGSGASVEIPSGVTSIGNITFEECSGLTSVTIPSGVTSIGYRSFYQCTGLQNITFLATTPPRFTDGEPLDETNNCPIYVPASSVEAYKAASGWSTYADRIQAIP